MIDITYTVASAFVGVSWSISLVMLLIHIFSIKMSARMAAFYISSITCLMTVLFMLLDDNYIAPRTLIIIAYIFILICASIKNMQKSVMIFSVYVVIISAAEVVDVILLYKVFDYTPVTCFIINTISMQVFTFVVYAIKIWFIRIVNKNTDSPERETLGLTLLAACAIFLATYIQLEFEYSLLMGEDMNQKTYEMFLAITAVTYLAAAIAAMGFIKSAGIERKNKIITEQQRILEEMHDSTRVFRHNYKNTIIALKGYCNNGDYDELSKRVNELYHDIDDIYNSGNMSKALNISDAGFRNLIMLKVLEAKRRDITVDMRISGGHFSSFENIHMLNAVGALLDNAIESSCESKEKYMALELDEGQTGQRIMIANSFGDKPDMAKIMSKDYSTKNQSGLGLYYVNRVVEKKKDMEIAFNCSDELFSVCLESVTG